MFFVIFLRSYIKFRSIPTKIFICKLNSNNLSQEKESNSFLIEKNCIQKYSHFLCDLNFTIFPKKMIEHNKSQNIKNQMTFSTQNTLKNHCYFWFDVRQLIFVGLREICHSHFISKTKIQNCSQTI